MAPLLWDSSDNMIGYSYFGCSGKILNLVDYCCHNLEALLVSCVVCAGLWSLSQKLLNVGAQIWLPFQFHRYSL